MIASPRQNWLAFVATWHSIIYLYSSFLTHESQFHPIFTCWRNDGYSIFLWINSLPNSFSRIDISDSSVSNKLELGSDPLAVFWHSETQVKTTINWNLNCLGLISGIICRSTLSRWFLLCFLISCCCLLCFFSLFNFSLSFKTLNKTNYFWFWHEFLFIDGRLCFI